MASSGTTLFNPAVVFIITSAYRKLGVINEDENPSAGMMSDALFALNSLTKEWMATGIHVWTEEEAILFLQPNQARYLIGGTTTAVTSDANNWNLLTLASSAALSSTTITLVSATGVIDNQPIGIILDDGTTQWTTVDGTPVGNVVTLATALTASASSGNYVFTYTTKIFRPLKVPSARRFGYNGRIETPMRVFSRREYMDLPNKTNPGLPTAFFYSPSLVSGELYVWPVPMNSSFGIRFTWYRPLQDFNDPNDTSDLPAEWINALTWNLAVELAPDFSIPAPRFAILKSQAAEKLELAEGWDREAQPIFFGVSFEEGRY